jgi:outer membrane protein OmpA-like peptidoglycan-associated protein
MKMISSAVLAASVLAACATPPAGTPDSTAAAPQKVAPAAKASAGLSPSETLYADLQKACPDDAQLGLHYLPDHSIALLLAGDNAFAFGSDSVRPEQATLLEPVGAVLHAHPQSHVEIVGYTDNVGNAAFNRALSERRAQSVARLLVAHGVPAAAVETRGAGADDPIADNGTAAGRSLNRRVEIFISASALAPVADTAH